MNPISLAQDLIRCDSVTHSCNSACTEVLKNRPASLGFEVSLQSYRDVHGIEKRLLSCLRKGRSTSDQGIAFFAHNDVVSVDGWRAENKCGPFDGIVDAGRPEGRGACGSERPVLLRYLPSLPSTKQRKSHPSTSLLLATKECGMVETKDLSSAMPRISQNGGSQFSWHHHRAHSTANRQFTQRRLSIHCHRTWYRRSQHQRRFECQLAAHSLLTYLREVCSHRNRTFASQ